jgi:hypothetical protein
MYFVLQLVSRPAGRSNHLTIRVGQLSSKSLALLQYIACLHAEYLYSFSPSFLCSPVRDSMSFRTACDLAVQASYRVQPIRVFRSFRWYAGILPLLNTVFSLLSVSVKSCSKGVFDITCVSSLKVRTLLLNFRAFIEIPMDKRL